MKRTCQKKYREVPLLLQTGAPIPGAREPSVYATSSVEKIIGTRPIEAVTEKVSKNVKY